MIKSCHSISHVDAQRCFPHHLLPRQGIVAGLSNSLLRFLHCREVKDLGSRLARIFKSDEAPNAISNTAEAERFDEELDAALPAQDGRCAKSLALSLNLHELLQSPSGRTCGRHMPVMLCECVLFWKESLEYENLTDASSPTLD